MEVGEALGPDEPPEQRTPLVVVVEKSLPVPEFSSAQRVASLIALPSASFFLEAGIGG